MTCDAGNAFAVWPRDTYGKYQAHKFVRERIKHVYGINLLGTAFIKSALVQTSKNTITPHTSRLKSISKYQLLTFHL